MGTLAEEAGSFWRPRPFCAVSGVVTSAEALGAALAACTRSAAHCPYYGDYGSCYALTPFGYARVCN